MRAWVLLLAVAAACRGHPLYRAPVSDDPAATYRALLREGKRGIPAEDEALYLCELGSAALAAGDEQAAFKAFHRASIIMGTLESSSEENAKAIFGEEATKTWKGDPHERCMNALYKGLLYWRRNDLENAAACFKRGLLADAWSAEGKSQRDFAALAFLLGWVDALRGQHEQARFHFREAEELLPDNPYVKDPRPDRDNVLVVADIGRGPKKYATGRHLEIARYARRLSPARAIEVLVDGRRAGRSFPATDLFVQAMTRGKRVIDGIRKGKAIFKSGTGLAGAVLLSEGLEEKDKGEIAVGLGLLVLSALTNAEADTRYWTQLPGEIHLLPLRIPSGPHRITVRALNAAGAPVAGWARTFPTYVPPGPGTVFWFTTAHDRTIYGLLGLPVEESP